MNNKFDKSVFLSLGDANPNISDTVYKTVTGKATWATRTPLGLHDDLYIGKLMVDMATSRDWSMASTCWRSALVSESAILQDVTSGVYGIVLASCSWGVLVWPLEVLDIGSQRFAKPATNAERGKPVLWTVCGFGIGWWACFEFEARWFTITLGAHRHPCHAAGGRNSNSLIVQLSGKELFVGVWALCHGIDSAAQSDLGFSRGRRFNKHRSAGHSTRCPWAQPLCACRRCHGGTLACEPSPLQQKSLSTPALMPALALATWRGGLRIAGLGPDCSDSAMQLESRSGCSLILRCRLR